MHVQCTLNYSGTSSIEETLFQFPEGVHTAQNYTFPVFSSCVWEVLKCSYNPGQKQVGYPEKCYCSCSTTESSPFSYKLKIRIKASTWAQEFCTMCNEHKANLNMCSCLNQCMYMYLHQVHFHCEINWLLCLHLFLSCACAACTCSLAAWLLTRKYWHWLTW